MSEGQATEFAPDPDWDRLARNTVYSLEEWRHAARYLGDLPHWRDLWPAVEQAAALYGPLGAAQTVRQAALAMPPHLPVQTSGVGADTGEAGCLPSPPSPRGGPPPRPTPEPDYTPAQTETPDLLAALQRSLTAARANADNTPAQTEEADRG